MSNDKRTALGRFAPKERNIVTIECHCGCGGTLQSYDKKGRQRFFLIGHREGGIAGRHLRAGYVFVKNTAHPRSSGQGYVQEHILIAEKALGRILTDGAEIHHFNEIRSDNRNSNLVICESKKYHALLHVRQRIVAAGGNPSLDQWCIYCRQVKPLADFTKKPRGATCFPCNRANQKRRREARKARAA